MGATDSAAPCAMLLDLAVFLTPLLQVRQTRIASGAGLLREGFDEEEAAETTIQLIFFDGEEAFRIWTDTDSIYGARCIPSSASSQSAIAETTKPPRHLASLWESTYLSATHPLTRNRRFGTMPTVLNTIDHLVLLDLLGNTHSRILSYYRETDWLFEEMANADRRLREAGLVEVEVGEDGWFGTQRMHKGMIGDDHTPVSRDANTHKL